MAHMPVLPLRIRASDVAALSGQHKYQTKDDVIVQTIKRNHRSMYQAYVTHVNEGVVDTPCERVETILRADHLSTQAVDALARAAVICPKERKEQTQRITARVCASIDTTVKEEMKSLEAAEATAASAQQQMDVARQSVASLREHVTHIAHESERPDETTPKRQKMEMPVIDPVEADDRKSRIDAQIATERLTMQRAAFDSKQAEVRMAHARQKIDLMQRARKLAEEKVTKIIHTQSGIQQERRALDMHQDKVTDLIIRRNDQCLIKRMGTWTLMGKIDGWSEKESCVVESKNRQNHMMTVVPLYERIQLHTYMELTNTRRSLLLQTFNGDQDVRTVLFDDELWARTLDELGSVVRAVQSAHRRFAVDRNDLCDSILALFTRALCA